MNLKDKLLLTVLLTTLQSTAGISVALAQQATFEQLIARFESGCVFHANFTYEQSDSYVGQTNRSEGTLWVTHDAYKVQSEGQTIVVDGITSRVYDESRNRVIVSLYEPEEDDFAPSRFLSGTDTTYTVAEQRSEGENTIIVFESDDPFALFTTVEVTLGPELLPLEIFTVDQGDNSVTTSFQTGSFKAEQDGMFELEYPEDAEIIDMRN